jgi:hypothetical protein
MDSIASYSSGIAKNAFAVITDIFSEATVNFLLALTDLIEILLVAGVIICILIILLINAIESVLIKDKYEGNEVLKLISKILKRSYLYFYFITIRFFVAIVNIQIVVFDITWYQLLAYSFIILSWLFISVKND